jgi:hypothetical protein
MLEYTEAGKVSEVVVVARAGRSVSAALPSESNTQIKWIDAKRLRIGQHVLATIDSRSELQLSMVESSNRQDQEVRNDQLSKYKILSSLSGSEADWWPLGVYLK